MFFPSSIRRLATTTLSRMSDSLKLYTFPTPNGTAASIFLEELKAAYGADVIDYE